MKPSKLKIAQAEILELMLNARVVTKGQLRDMAKQLRKDAAVEAIEEQAWGQIKLGKYTLIKNDYDGDILQVLFDGQQEPVPEGAIAGLLDALFKQRDGAPMVIDAGAAVLVDMPKDKDMEAIADHLRRNQLAKGKK